MLETAVHGQRRQGLTAEQESRRAALDQNSCCVTEDVQRALLPSMLGPELPFVVFAGVCLASCVRIELVCVNNNQLWSQISRMLESTVVFHW